MPERYFDSAQRTCLILLSSVLFRFHLFKQDSILHTNIWLHICWGWNTQSVVCWAYCPAWGSVTSLISSEPPVEGITWVLTPFPQTSFGREYKPRSSLCKHALNCMDKNNPDIHVLDQRWEWRKVKKPEVGPCGTCRRPLVGSRGNTSRWGQGAQSPEAEGFF